MEKTAEELKAQSEEERTRVTGAHTHTTIHFTTITTNMPPLKAVEILKALHIIMHTRINKLLRQHAHAHGLRKAPIGQFTLICTHDARLHTRTHRTCVTYIGAEMFVNAWCVGVTSTRIREWIDRLKRVRRIN